MEENATFEFPIDKFCIYFHHFPIQVDAALHILTRAGYIHYNSEPDTKARIHFILSRDELYRLGEQTGERRNGNFCFVKKLSWSVYRLSLC